MSNRKTQDEEIVISLRIHPLARQQRRVQQNRDLMEKDRVSNRVENFERHEVGNIVETRYNEHNRFGDNFEYMERERKRQQRAAKTEYLQQMGELQAYREQYYKNMEVEKDKKYEEGIAARGSKKNQSGEPFNIITREYHNQEIKDELERKARQEYDSSLARKEMLAKKAGLGYNLLTGEEYNWRLNK